MAVTKLVVDVQSMAMSVSVCMSASYHIAKITFKPSPNLRSSFCAVAIR